MTADPRTHHCTERDVDYRNVEIGHLECRTCGAEFKVDPKRGWIRNPQPRRTNDNRNR